MTTQTAPEMNTIPNTGDHAPDATVQSLDGEAIALQQLWQSTARGLALVFLRHYGCSFCMEHARELERRKEAIAEAGIAVALVGCGSLEEAARFRQALTLTIPIYNDADRGAYRAYGVGETTARSVLNPRVIAGGIRAMGKGNLPRHSSGDPLQLHGQFLIDRDGIVRSVSRPALMSEIPSIDALLEDAAALNRR